VRITGVSTAHRGILTRQSPTSAELGCRSPARQFDSSHTTVFEASTSSDAERPKLADPAFSAVTPVTRNNFPKPQAVSVCCVNCQGIDWSSLSLNRCPACTVQTWTFLMAGRSMSLVGAGGAQLEHHTSQPFMIKISHRIHTTQSSFQL
jgi:hypothetical protein